MTGDAPGTRCYLFVRLLIQKQGEFSIIPTDTQSPTATYCHLLPTATQSRHSVTQVKHTFGFSLSNSANACENKRDYCLPPIAEDSGNQQLGLLKFATPSSLSCMMEEHVDEAMQETEEDSRYLLVSGQNSYHEQLLRLLQKSLMFAQVSHSTKPGSCKLACDQQEPDNNEMIIIMTSCNSTQQEPDNNGIIIIMTSCDSTQQEPDNNILIIMMT